MNPLPQTNYLRTTTVNGYSSRTQKYVVSETERIKQQLHSLGVSRFALHSEEARYLPQIIHPDEYIQGVVYGKAMEGFAMLLITDQRVIFLDRKPLFVNEDEITFDVVSGINVSSIGFGTTVTLHTRIKDYSIRTLNTKCAKSFAFAVERRCIEQKLKEGRRYETALPIQR